MLSTISFSTWCPLSRCRRQRQQPQCSASEVQKGHRAPRGATEDRRPQQLSRRAALLAVTGAVVWPKSARAEAEEAPSTLQPPAAARPAAKKSTKTYNERDFVLEVPSGFREVKDEAAASGFAAGGRPQSTRERIAAITPLRAKFVSEDGQEQLTVIERNASEIKQFIFQVTDIQQFGSLDDVAGLLLPKEVQVLAQGGASLDQEPRDTGTVRGVVQLPPQTFYRYTFRGRGQRAHLSIVAKAGKLYLVAGSTREDSWAAATDRLKAAVVSFRLV